MAFIPSLGDFEGWALTGIGGLAGAAALWARLNKTKTEATSSKIEGGWLTQLVKDRDTAQANERAAVEREKALNQKYEELKLRYNTLEGEYRVLDDRLVTLGRRIEMLTLIVIEDRPELESFLKSSAFGEEVRVRKTDGK